MRGWIRKWKWFLAVAAATILIIGWEETRGQTQAYQCQAQYAAELSGVEPNQKAPEQQAIKAACEPDDYFYPLFSPANIPAVILVFIGIGGVWAALRTLKAIEQQTEATKVAAEATQKSVTLQEVLRKWTVLLSPASTPEITSIDIGFEIVNPTNFPMELATVRTDFGDNRTSQSGNKNLLAPREPYFTSATIALTPEEDRLFRRLMLQLDVDCIVVFRDSRNIPHVQQFAGPLMCSSGIDGREGAAYFVASIAGPPEKMKTDENE